MTGFTTGLHCAFSGLRLITLPGIRAYVVIPLLLNTLIFAAVIIYGVSGLDDLIHWISEQWTWLDWIAWLLWPVFIVVSLLVVFFCFALLANLIAAPFNGFLSAAVEYRLTGTRPQEAVTLGGLPGEIMAVMGSETRKFVYFIIRALPLLLVFIIPFVQAVAPVIWFLFAAWMMAVEYMDYPMGNRGMLFPDIRRELLQRRTLSLGFGTGILFLTMIPVLNFVAMPAGVAGATRLYVERFGAVNTA